MSSFSHTAASLWAAFRAAASASSASRSLAVRLQGPLLCRRLDPEGVGAPPLPTGTRAVDDSVPPPVGAGSAVVRAGGLLGTGAGAASAGSSGTTLWVDNGTSAGV